MITINVPEIYVSCIAYIYSREPKVEPTILGYRMVITAPFREPMLTAKPRPVPAFVMRGGGMELPVGKVNRLYHPA